MLLLKLLIIFFFQITCGTNPNRFSNCCCCCCFCTHVRFGSSSSLIPPNPFFTRIKRDIRNMNRSPFSCHILWVTIPPLTDWELIEELKKKMDDFRNSRRDLKLKVFSYYYYYLFTRMGSINIRLYPTILRRL